MNDSLHSRNPPKASASSGTPYQLILEHVFQQSGTYEIPLRTMYAINCSPIAQSKPRSDIRLAGPPPTYAPPAVPGSQQVPLAPATAQFTSALIDHIASLPTQPCSLPTPFITTFLRRCFCAEYALVDFSQALTGLDYLKDLETKRRRATAAAFTKLGLDKESLGTSADQISAFSPPVAAWHKSITDSERKVEALYTQVYIGLRRWILINELQTAPFHKYNCLAMLNTLYPPRAPGQPNANLTPRVMANQRNGFFKYIQSVDQHGPGVLAPLLQQGKLRPSDTNGWSAVRETLDSYLRVANSLIDDCEHVTCVEDIERRQSVSSKRSKGSNADSGISFGNSTALRSRTSMSEDGDRNNEHPHPTAVAKVEPKIAPHNGSPMWQFSRGFSKLERIAAELRKIKSSRQIKTTTVAETSEANKENIQVTISHLNSTVSKQTSTQLKRPADDSDMPKVLEQEKKHEQRGGTMRKLRSLGDLRSSASRSNLRSQSRGPSEHGEKQSAISELFDVEEMRRKRMIWEANARRQKEDKDRQAQEETDRKQQEEKTKDNAQTTKAHSEHVEAVSKTLGKVAEGRTPSQTPMAA